MRSRFCLYWLLWLRATMRPANQKLLVVFLAAALVTVAATGSIGMTSSHYRIPWSVFGMGGGSMSSPHYALNGTFSQTSVGQSESESYTIQGGFWPVYQALKHSLSMRYKGYFPLFMPER